MTLIEYHNVLSHLTVKQRLHACALEMRNLGEICGEGSEYEDIYDDLENGGYETVILKCEGNYEPPDPPGWEGGFAWNH